MIVVDLIITVLAYMLIPFIYFYILKKKMVKRKIILFNFINSFVVMLIFMAIRQYLSESNLYSGAPSLLYWCINNFIYTRFSIKNDNEDKNIESKAKKEIKIGNKIELKRKNDKKVIQKNNIISSNIKSREKIIVRFILLLIFVSSFTINIIFVINQNKIKINNNYETKYLSLDNKVKNLEECFLNSREKMIDELYKRCPESLSNCWTKNLDSVNLGYGEDIDNCLMNFFN